MATYDFTNGELHFALTDPLGTKRVQAVVNPAGLGVVEQQCYGLPFGNEIGNPRKVNCTTPTNGIAGTDATEQHFTGKERDTESGNDYFGARYYASSMGRWLSPDWSAKVMPVPYAKLDNPQSLNLYAYVANNPLSRIDPDGHYECNGSKDQCAQIQTALNLAKAAVKNLGADSKEGKAIQKVIDLYGDAGKKNGVNVSFGTFKNPNTTGQAVMGKDGSLNIKFNLTKINADGSHSLQPGASMFGERVGTVVHEITYAFFRTFDLP